MSRYNRSRDHWDEAVKRPGKFQGEKPYVPYYWDCYLDGMVDEDDGDVLKFHVTREDREMFPELRDRRTVRLRELDNGFVVEV